MKISLLMLFWGLWFVNFSTRTIISPLLPVIEGELGISHTLAGSIASSLFLGYTVTLLLSGLLSPRMGYKRSIIAGFAICMAALFSLKYAGTYSSMVVATLFIGLGAGMYLPSAIPLLTAIFGQDNWGKAIAFHDTAASLSVFSIPILTALALRALSWRELFGILSAACLITVIVFWAFSPDPRPAGDKGTGLTALFARREFWIMASLWVLGASNGLGLYNVIPLFIVKERGMDLDTANTIFGFSRLGGLAVVLVAGFLVDRYGVKKILFAAFLATGVSTIGLAIAQGVGLMVTMLILQAIFSTLFFPVALVAISRLTTFTERSIFTGGTVAIGVFFGAGLTPLMLGAVADVWSFQFGILLLGAITTLSSAFMGNLQGI